MATHYPDMADRATGKYGSSRGWRRNRLRTRTGFTVDALGLDTAMRGAKLEDQRPDLIILDDIDDQHDSPTVVTRKLRTLTQATLLAGTPYTAVAFANNLTHPGAIAAKLASRQTDMLAHATLSGPMPAVEHLQVDLVDHTWRVTGGQPTWAGMALPEVQALIDLVGLTAFTIESQQEIEELPGALWTRQVINDTRMERGTTPELDRVIVAVDPNKTGRSDDAGVVVIGRAVIDGVAHAYVLDDLSGRRAPSAWRDSAAEAFLDWHAAAFVVESAGLGEHAGITVRSHPSLHGLGVTVHDAEAKLGKLDRARPVAQLYRDGRVHHAGVHPYLEQQMTSWEPETSHLSPGAVDALVHGTTHLLLDRRGTPRASWL
jgi:hypothetical protein